MEGNTVLAENQLDQNYQNYQGGQKYYKGNKPYKVRLL